MPEVQTLVKKLVIFLVDPFNEILVVLFVGGNIPFANIVGLAGAVSPIDASLFEEMVLEGYVLLVNLDGGLHIISAEASDGYVAVVFHVFVLFAKELNLGLRVFATKGEGNKDVVMNGRSSCWVLKNISRNGWRQVVSLDPAWTSYASAVMLPCTLDSLFSFRLAGCIWGKEKPV
jgi:hypothetical protein